MIDVRRKEERLSPSCAQSKHALAIASALKQTATDHTQLATPFLCVIHKNIVSTRVKTCRIARARFRALKKTGESRLDAFCCEKSAGNRKRGKKINETHRLIRKCRFPTTFREANVMLASNNGRIGGAKVT